MPAQIRPNRLEVSDRFPMLGLTIRTDGTPQRAEVTVATDIALFRPENRARRTTANFYSSRADGQLAVPRGEAVYLVPPAVLARFIGAERLFVALATAPERNGSAFRVDVQPFEGSPYISLKNLTGRSLRRVRLLPGRPERGPGYGINGTGGLEWAGDAAQPGLQPAGTAPSPSGQPPAPPPSASGEHDYDDGFGPMPVSDAQPPAPPAQEEKAVPAAQSLEQVPEVADEDASHDIGGPIPDPSASSQSLGYGHAFSQGPEYPQSSRFEAAAAGNYRGVAGTRNIDRIVIHITDGGPKIDGSISWFKNPAAKVSAHYVVGQNGEVVQMVRHNDVAWHAGKANGSSIGIEHVANTRGLLPSEAQYCASAALVSWLCDSFGIPKDRDHILGHAEADTHTTHTGCPNAVWDWTYYMDLITNSYCRPRQETSGQGLGASALGTDIPLDPGNGGRSIGDDALEIGDIILSTTAAYTSGIIRAGSRSVVSHAMLYVGQGGQVIDSTPAGVRLRPLSEALSDATLAVAFRYPDLSDEQRQIIADKAGQYIGRQYNYWGIVRQAAFQVHRTVCDLLPESEGGQCRQFVGKVDLGTGGGSEFFCSELVVAAYQEAGVQITTTPPNWSSPDDLAQLSMRSGVLAYVGHLKAPPYTPRRSLWETVGLGLAIGDELPLGGGRASVRALSAERRPARFPEIRSLSPLEREIALAALGILNPGVGALITASRAAARGLGLSVAIGPSVSAGFLVGMGVGAGLVFTPDGGVGIYGQFDIRGGWIDSASVELQITIVRGGLEGFSGINWAVAVEVDAGVSVSAQALFDTSLSFQGVTFGAGAGLGVEPIQVFLSLQGSEATSLALALPMAVSRLPQPPARRIPEALAQEAELPVPFPGAVLSRIQGQEGKVSWRLDQLRGIKQPAGIAPGAGAPTPGPAISLADWPIVPGTNGNACLPLTVTYAYDGAGVGNVAIQPGRAESAQGISLDVVATIGSAMDQGTPPVAALKVAVEYRFTWEDGVSETAVVELILMGNGRYQRNNQGEPAPHLEFA